MKIRNLLRTAMTVLVLALWVSVGWGQEVISGWTFPTTTGNIASNVPAECGVMQPSSMIYADGTNGSDNWIGTSGSIVYFGGVAPAASLCDVSTATGALSLVNLSTAWNNKAIVFKLSLSGYENLILSYSTRGTSTGFASHEWFYSVNGTDYTSHATITGRTSTTFSTQTVDFSSITSIDNQASVYIKVVVSGASGTGNNRFDNIQFSATEIPSVSTYTVNFSVFGGNGSVSATADGTPITSGDDVDANAEVVFTATPDANFQVKEWRNNTVLVDGNTTTSYTIASLSENTTVTVEFEAIPLPSVTFNVDMSNASGFNPATDDVYISGTISAPEWIEPGDNATYKLAPVVPGSKIYTLTLSIANGTYDYKYFRNTTWANGEPIAGNRSVTVSGNKIVDNVWGVNAHPVIGWANLDDPSSGEINIGEAFESKAQIWISDVTSAIDAPYEIIKVWIGFKNANSNPSTWEESDWISAIYNAKIGNNHQYKADIGSAISSAGTYYYASRFQFGSGEYYYGGYNGGAWNGTSNVSGTLTVHQTYAVNFSVTGGNGAISAKVDEVAITSGQEIRTGKNVVFTATPDGGYQVKEWKLNGVAVPDNTSNTYTLTNLSAAATVTVEYEVVPSTLYVVNFSVFNGNGSLAATVDAVGINSGDQVLEGKNVVFTATPDAGYRVKEWTLNTVPVDGNKTNSYTLSNLSAAATVTVEFELIPEFTLTITKVGDGEVTVDGAEYTVPMNFDDGTGLSLVATASAGWAFTGWSGDLVSANAAETITMDASKNITATFVRVPVQLVMWNFDDDNLVPDGGIAANLDRTISTTATGTLAYINNLPGRAVSIGGWHSGDGVKYWMTDFTTSGYESITLSSKQRSSNTGPANFKLQIRLNGTDWTDLAGGSVTVANNYTTGVLTNLALPSLANNQGRVYVRWIMTSNTAVNASPVAEGGTSALDDIVIKGLTLSGGIQRTLVLAKAGNGTIAPSAGNYAYNNGTQITLTAAPEVGWEFTGWSGDLTSTDLSVGVTMDADKTITATFIEDLPEYAVTFNVDMAPAIAKGLFNPATELVYVVGNFTADWAGSLELTKVGETTIYSATTAAVFNAGNSLAFKFRVEATGWETGANRNYTVIDGANEVNATFNTPQITWANLQWPETESNNIGNETFNAYARIYIENVTGSGAVGSISGLQVWLGINTTNATDVADFATGWNWIPATLTEYEAGFGNNSQYVANLMTAISVPGTYYYVSRFQYGNDAMVYGGYNTGYWDGSETKKSGVLTVNITDAYKVAQDKGALDYDDFTFDGTEDQNNVKSNFGLPGVGEMYFSAITWISDDTDVITIDADGENWTAQVTRPLPSGGKGDAIVTLTATINSNGTTDTKEFQVVVKEDLSSFVAALTTPGNKTTGVAFSISLSAGQDVDGNALVGNKTVIVSSSKDGVVFNGLKTFAAGATTVSVTLISLDTHTLTISVSGVTESETFDVVVEAAPTYSVSIKVGEAPVEASYGFGTKVLGYAPVAAETFTITRTGDGDITGLAAALSGDNAGDFTITAVLATELTAVSPSTTFTVKPNDGLAVGTYTAQVDVTADNGVSESFAVSFEVLTPTYTINLNVVDNAIDFGTETVGYESFTDSTVTITKTGNSDITSLAVSLSSGNTDAFVLSAVGATTLTEGAPSTTFTVRPADGLAYGSYNAVVTVTADNGVSEAFNVTFTVYSYQISLNADNPTVFETQYLGYAAFENDTVIITRTANGIVTALAVGLSGTNPESFTVTQPEILTLDNDNNSTIFTVKPNHDLAVGQYAAIVTVTANNAIEETFNVQFEVLEPLSTEANITAFSFAEQTGAAVIGDGTIAIEVANGTNLTNLVATFTLSDGASVKIGEAVQESGVTENDFTNVVTYVVTAENGTTTKNWDVTVTVAAPEPVAILPINVFSGPWFGITETGWSQSGLGTDYSGVKAKFDGAGDWLKVHFNSAPGMLTCFLKGNTSGTPWDGTFVIEESSNGIDWTNVHTFTGAGSIPISAYTEYSYILLQSSRYVRWTYEAKVNGNVGLDDVTITKYVAPLPNYAVNFSVVGIGGDISATVDGNAIVSGAEVVSGKNIAFTAIPDAGYRVKEWKKNSEVVAGNTTNNYTLENLAAAATVTVEFEEIPPVLYTVTFAVTGENGTLAATVDGNPILSGAEVEEGSTIIFTATPADGYRVKEWTLNTAVVVGNTTNTYTLGNLTAAAHVTVEFEQLPENTYIVTFAVVNGNGSLTAKANGVIIESGNAVYEGDDLIFTAVPNAGFRVKEWTLNAEVVVGNITNTFSVLNIAATATVTVEFEAIPQYTLTVIVAGNGSVTVDGTAYTEAVMFYEGTVATVVATPDAGWQFDSWTGAVAEASEATTTVTMDADQTITATFTEIPVVYYTVDYNVVGGNGNLLASIQGVNLASGTEVEEGSQVDFEAVANENYRVKEWKINAEVVIGNKTNLLTIYDLSEASTVTVEFEMIPLGTLLLSENFDYTTGTFLTANGWTAHNGAGTTPITVVSPGLEFSGYIGSAIGNAAAVSNTGEDVHRTFTEQTNGKIYAAFIVKTEASNSEGYFLNLGQSTIGTTFFGRVWVNASGSALGLGTYGTGVSPTNYVSITPGTPTLVVLKHDFASKVSGLFVFNSFPTTEPGVANVIFTETATFTNIGSIALRQYNASQRIIVDGIRVATSWSEAVKSGAVTPSFAVNFNVIGNGGNLTATVDGNSIVSGALVNQGKNVVFTATPGADYRVKEWKLNNEVVAGNTTNTYTLENLTAEATVTVEFEEIPPVLYAVTFEVTGENGSLAATVDGNPILSGVEVEEGNAVIFTATPADGYRVKEWTFNNDVVVGHTSNIFTIDNLNSAVHVTVEFEQLPENTYVVTFEVVNGNGNLTAKANGVTIESGNAVYEGDDVIFTAVPDAGFRVKEWTLNTEVVVGNTTNTFSILDIAAVANVTVEFEAIPQYALTVNVAGNGSVTVDGTAYTEAVMFYEGSVATVVATPGAGWQFGSWTGPVAEALQATTTVTMDADKTITATFTEIPVVYYTVNYSVVDGNGNLAATVSGSPINNGAQVEEGSTVNFIATADNGYRVKVWKLNNNTVANNTTNNYSISNLSADATVTVEFELIPAPQDLLLVENFDYVEGSLLTANGWTAHSAGINPQTVVAPGLTYPNYIASGVGLANSMLKTGEDVSKPLEAQTTGTVYTAFMANISDAGTIDAGDYFFHYMTESTTNFRGRLFVKKHVSEPKLAFGVTRGANGASATWTGFDYNIGTTYLFVMKYQFVDGDANDVVSLYINPQIGVAEPVALVVNGIETQSDFTVSQPLNAIALRQGGSTTGSIQTIDGIRVAKTWQEAVKGTSTDVYYTVNFAVEGIGGTMEALVNAMPINSGAQVLEGIDVLFNANPFEGFRVSEWTVNSNVVEGNTSNSLLVTNLQSDIDVSVSFSEIPQYTASISIVGNGYVNVNGELLTGPITVYEGTELTIEAVPATNWAFEGWTGDYVSTNPVETIVVNGDMNITATFIDVTVYYAITFAAGDNGAIEATYNGNAITSGQEVPGGSSVLFTATPDAGYRVKNWIGNGNVIAGNTSNTLLVTDIESSINVFVEFELLPENQYTVTFSVVNGNGALQAYVDGVAIISGDLVYEGEGVIFNALPDLGFRVKQWTLGGTVVDNNTSETFSIASLMANVNVTVEFEAIPTYSLDITVVGNGTVNVNGSPFTVTVWFFEGETANLQAIADAGWAFQGWTGGVVSANPSETLVITQNTAITATFIEVQTDVTLVGWIFDDQNAVADLGIAQNLERAMEVNTGGTISYVAGVGTSSFAMSSNLWTDGSGIKAWYTSFTTTGYQAIKLSSVQRSSSTGARDFKVQYRIDGMPWTDVPGAAVTTADNFTSGALNNIELPALCNNQGVVYLRWIMTSNTSVSGSTVVNAGTSRIDNVMVKGSTLPGAIQHSLVLNKTGLGTIVPTEGTYVFNSGTPVTISATPQVGQVFDGWVGDFNSVNPTDVVTMDGNKTITAMFRPFMSASINPTSGDFYEDEPENLTTVITWNDASAVTSVVVSAFGELFTLVEGEDYTITDIDGATALLTFVMTGEKFRNTTSRELEVMPCEISFDAGESAIYTINYNWEEEYYVMFNVTSSGSPVENAQINIDGGTYFTDANGQAELMLIDGSYPFEVIKDNYVTYEGTVVVDGSDQTVNVVLVSGINSLSATTIRSYPNPVVDMLTLNRDTSGNVVIEIYSVNGSLVHTQEWTTETLTLNLNDLKTGLFTIRVTGNGKVETLRFVKQ